MGRQGHDSSATAAPGMRIQRSQSKLSLSASFEALAVYFPCMNSFDEGSAGETAGYYHSTTPAFRAGPL